MLPFKYIFKGEKKDERILVTLEFGSRSLISAIFVSGIQVFCFLGSTDFLLFIIAILFSSIHQLNIASVLPSS